MNFKKVSLILAMVMVSAVGFSACAEEKNYNAISYYDSTTYLDGYSTAYYNTALYRRNDSVVSGADPAVIRVTDTESEDYGLFYLFTTGTGFPCYRSDDLTNWTACGISLSESVLSSGCFYANSWAPEVIYDSDDGLYYMLCSGTPASKAGGSSSNSKSVNCIMYLLSSENPEGPYDFVSNTESRDSSYTTSDGETYSYTDWWASYMYFDPAAFAKEVDSRLVEFSQNNQLFNYNTSGYFSTIDPYFYIDDDGTRYVYFVFRNSSFTRYLAGVQCGDSWTDIKYETLTLLTYSGYYDVQGTQVCSYQNGSSIDEGPVMIKHNGIYYLTYSFGSADGDYQVAQAVSDSPLGTFRKLEESENAILLSHDMTAFDIGGPGGHSYVEVDGELYIVYHRQISTRNTDLSNRVIASDKLEWVTITSDVTGEEIDVLYANGPTITLQPKFSFASDYQNIASDASVTATNMESGSSADALTDGLLSMYQYVDSEFNDNYVLETYFDGTATITLSFEDYRTIRGIMIYNSKYLSCAYLQIKRVEFDCIDDEGNEVTNYIANLQMDWRGAYNYQNFSESYRNAVAAVAEFYEIQCKEIRITIEIPSSGWVINEDGTITYEEEDYMMFTHENRVGLSEIVVLGK